MDFGRFSIFFLHSLIFSHRSTLQPIIEFFKSPISQEMVVNLENFTYFHHSPWLTLPDTPMCSLVRINQFFFRSPLFSLSFHQPSK
jgi:hypothetical protein